MATNSTTYYNLPVFAATDQPKWLVDWNGTMNIIDGAIAQAKAAGDNAQTTADANALAITGLSESVSTISTALGTLTTNVTTLTGNVQRINELIGNGTPTTQDKTIIGAINELKAAIDALAPGGEVDADDVSYNNTSSGLTATNVQDAIDEVNAKITGDIYDFDLSAHTGTFTVTMASAFTGYISDVSYALNSDKSIGKIYGAIGATTTSVLTMETWNKVCTLSSADMPTIPASYNIVFGGSPFYESGTMRLAKQRFVFNTDGTIDVEVYQAGANQPANSVLGISLPPCIYFLKDFGD